MPAGPGAGADAGQRRVDEVIAGSPDTRLGGAPAGPAGRYGRLRYEAEILAFIVNAGPET